MLYFSARYLFLMSLTERFEVGTFYYHRNQLKFRNLFDHIQVEIM